MRESLTNEEKQKLAELKLQLMNAQTDEERGALLGSIEQMLNNAKKRHKFIESLNR